MLGQAINRVKKTFRVCHFRFFGNRRGGPQILGYEWGVHPTHTPKSGINHGKSQRAAFSALG